MSSLDESILAFEKAWQPAAPPSIRAFIAGHQPGAATELTRELTLIDMEFRWQATWRRQRVEGDLGGEVSARAEPHHPAHPAHLEGLTRLDVGQRELSESGPGGDAPGLNAVIRAVTRTAILQEGWEVVGIRQGFEGLLADDDTGIDTG